MVRLLLGSLFLLGMLQSPPQDDITATLGRAQALYIEARFEESIDLLTPLDNQLLAEQGKSQEKIAVKLQLALAYVGLGSMDEARSFFSEITQIDPGYSLDPEKFSVKVISLFDEAKSEHNESACRTICLNADRTLESSDTEGLVREIEDARSKSLVCACLEATTLDAGEHFYQQGLESYKQEEFEVALTNFRTTLKILPNHQLATSYIELTLNKLRFVADRLFLEWRMNFETREFGRAAVTYHKLQEANIEGSAEHAIAEAQIQYRRELGNILESWKRACLTGNANTMENLRQQAAEMLPDAAIGQDMLDEMNTCLSQGCLQMTLQQAIARLRTRVDPELPPSPARSQPLTVRVYAIIDEHGDVKVADTQGGDAATRNAVKAAVERWKFLPARVNDQARCVETQIPIVVGP